MGTVETDQYERSGLVAPTWRSVLLADPCVYCHGKSENLDHIWPYSRGGTDGWPNRAPSCRACNSEKGNSSVLMFLAGFPIRARRREPHTPTYVLRREAKERIQAVQYGLFYRGNIRGLEARDDEA